MLLHQPPLHSPHQQHHTTHTHHTNHMKGVSSFFSKKYDGSVGSGILSPALSTSGAGGSTTVTPITPMTPLTTPRTPLQILLGRQNVGSLRGGPYRRTSITPQSTNHHHTRDSSASLSDTYHENEEDEDHYREKQLLALQLFANFLNTAETTLNDITERENSGHQVLGPGIVRVCHDLADEIESVAVALDKQHYQATQHLQQVMSDHELTLIEEGDTNTIIGDGEEKINSESIVDTNQDDPTNQTALALSATLAQSESIASFQSSQEEFITTLSNTHTLLLDMAAALRAVPQQEAQVLGEVALEVARMFVWSLGMVHSNMIQMTVQSEQHQQVHTILPVATNDERGHDEAAADESKQKSADGVTKHRVTWFNENTKDNQRGLGPVVEILGEEEKQNHPDTPPKARPDQLRYTPQLSPISSSPSPTSSLDNNNNRISVRHSGGERVRVLWPPLLPAVVDASKHCVNNAKEHPIPAIALGLTCGPAAIATAAIAGPPLLIADWAIQSSYDALSEHTPVIDNVERGAANALQVARLAILCSKLVVKQGVQVGERQISRRGGVGKICSDVVDGAVDMALHPVETIRMAWEGMFWMGGALGNAVNFVKDTVAGGDLQADIH